MAVALDAVGPSSAGAGSSAATTLSWSHTCTGSNRALIVGCAMGKQPDTGFSTVATYNGVSMTSIGVVHPNLDPAGYIQLWRLVAPATGANTVLVTASGGTPDALTGGSLSFTGVNQTTPVGTLFSSTGTLTTSGSVSVTGTTVGNMVVSAIGDGSGGEVATTGTLRWIHFTNNNTAAGSAAMSTIAAPGGTQAMSWTFNSDSWAILGLEVLAATGAGGLSSLLNPPPTNRVRLVRASSF